MTRWGYLWQLVRHSFHGMMRTLEVGEAAVAMLVYVVGYFVPEWKKPLEFLFVALLGLLVLTFFVGLFLAAHASNQEVEHVARKLAAEAESAFRGVIAAKDEQIEKLRSSVAGLEARLAGQGLEVEQLEAVRKQFAMLTQEDVATIRHLVVFGRATEHQLRSAAAQGGYTPVIMNRLASLVVFLDRTSTAAAWYVIPSMVDIVKQVLSEQPSRQEPT